MPICFSYQVSNIIIDLDGVRLRQSQEHRVVIDKWLCFLEVGCYFDRILQEIYVFFYGKWIEGYLIVVLSDINK